VLDASGESGHRHARAPAVEGIVGDVAEPRASLDLRRVRSPRRWARSVSSTVTITA
jgi:hypothetical protein